MQKHIFDLITDLKVMCNARDQKLCDELSLSPAEFNFFASYDFSGKITSTGISKTLNLSVSRTSRVIDKLVKSGLLKRRTGSSDRRVVFLNLSQKGKDIVEHIDKNKAECEQNLIEKLSVEELQEAKDVVGKIIKYL